MFAFGSTSGFSNTTASDAMSIARGFWRKLRRAVAYIPFAEDAITAYYCALDRQTPVRVRAALLAALVYFVLPTDVIPDFLPGLGYTDDAAVLAAALQLVASHILPEHRAAARRALEEVGTPHEQS
ncbi:MAG: YkvA family protein [Xanthobacteraceae bacterium]|nr:YkvA family protein [Xanthobacteraceae bacterium]